VDVADEGVAACEMGDLEFGLGLGEVLEGGLFDVFFCFFLESDL
jgi:hypothetical protein